MEPVVWGIPILSKDVVPGMGYSGGEFSTSFDFRSGYSVVGESCVDCLIPSCSDLCFAVVTRLDYSFATEGPY